MPGLFAIGCSARIWRAKWTLNRQKSISSQAASISAWIAVLDWPSMVAALRRWRQGPASRSAALRMIAARSSNDNARHPGAASLRGLDRGLGVAMRGALEGAEHVLVVVRLHDLDLGPAAVAPATADVGTQADLAPLLPDQLGEQRVPLGAARRVREVGLVDRVRRMGDGVHVRDAVRQPDRAQFLLRRHTWPVETAYMAR